MYGLTTSQSIAAISILVTIVFYFAANSGLKQNAWIFLFAVAVTVLVVGKSLNNADFLFMDEKTFEYEPHYENWQKKQEAEG